MRHCIEQQWTNAGCLTQYELLKLQENFPNLLHNFLDNGSYD